MPILPAEPEMFPLDLFLTDRPLAEPDRPGEGADDRRAWWCLHAKPRQEKATARFLRERGLFHYLPQVAKEGRTPRGRKTRSVIPLFPGYLFLLGSRRDRLEALQGNTLANVLDVGDQGRLEHDLRQIDQMLSSGLAVIPEPSYPVGTRVRLLSGPLVGLVGTVIRRGNSDHFVAVVDFLGSGAMVELEGWQVERVAG